MDKRSALPFKRLKNSSVLISAGLVTTFMLYAGNAVANPDTSHSVDAANTVDPVITPAETTGTPSATPSSGNVAAPRAPNAPKPPKEQLENQIRTTVDQLEKPLYSPFIERYVLDELKQLRTEQAAAKQELIQQIVDREHKSVDRAVAYATDTVTYFFYLIAGATSVLVLVGWTSIRDIRERVHSLADEEISKLISEYEKRLQKIEEQLTQKTQHIQESREELELTQEIQSLWLRAQQDQSHVNKISIYDEILKLRPEDCEALTYKADAVLELEEPQWAANLCHQALKLDPENSYAFYQLACAYTAMNQHEEALVYLSEAIKRRESYLEDIREDPALEPLITDNIFADLTKLIGTTTHSTHSNLS